MLLHLKRELDQLKASGCFRELTPVRKRDGATVLYKEKKLIDFTNWDLFGVSTDPDVLSAVHAHTELNGIGANSPRLSSGTAPEHLSLETRIAQMLARPASVLFSSRNQAVLSLVTTLLDDRSFALVDDLMLSPVSDAAYLVNAPFASFDAENPDSLRTELEKAPDYLRKFIFLEGVSPIRGKPIDIKPVLELARAYACVLVFDESFSLGLLGLNGGGVTEQCIGEGVSYCCFGSLSFGLSGIGAYVAGERELIEYLVNQSRTFLMEAPIPPALAAAFEVAMNKVELSVAARARLKDLGLKLKHGLASLSFHANLFPYPIVTVPFAHRTAAAEIADALVARGFLVELVSKGGFLDAGAVFRILINSAHTEAHIDGLLHAMSEIQTHVKGTL